MFLFFLIIIILLASLAMYYYLTEKLDTQRKQLLVLSKQNDVLRGKASKPGKHPFNFKDIKIKYSLAEFQEGITLEQTPLYIAPYVESPLIIYIEKPLRVNILIKSEFLNCTWYEVSLNTDSPINCRGWIKSDSIKQLN